MSNPVVEDHESSNFLRNIVPQSWEGKVAATVIGAGLALGATACAESPSTIQSSDKVTEAPATNYETPTATAEVTEAPVKLEAYVDALANAEASLTPGEQQFVEQFKSVDDLETQPVQVRVAYDYILFGDAKREFAEKFADLSGNPKDAYPETLSATSTTDEIASVLLNDFRFMTAVPVKTDGEYTLDGKMDVETAKEVATTIYFMPTASTDYAKTKELLGNMGGSFATNPERAFDFNRYPLDNPNLDTVYGEPYTSTVTGDPSQNVYTCRDVTQTVISSGQKINSTVIFIDGQPAFALPDGTTVSIPATYVIQNP